MNRWKLFWVTGVILLASYGTWKLYLSFLPLMEEYGEFALRQFTSAVAVHEKRAAFTKDLNQSLITVYYTAEGAIESIDYDVIMVNQMTDEMVSNIEGTIREVQSGQYQAKDDSRYERYLASISHQEGVLTTIPLETLISFPPLSFLHWRIPIRFQTESNVIGKVVQNVSDYGINNTLVTIEIQITVQQRMLLPFFHEIKKIELSFPIAMKLIQGKLPEIYWEDER